VLNAVAQAVTGKPRVAASKLFNCHVVTARGSLVRPARVAGRRRSGGRRDSSEQETGTILVQTTYTLPRTGLTVNPAALENRSSAK